MLLFLLVYVLGETDRACLPVFFSVRSVCVSLAIGDSALDCETIQTAAIRTTVK